MVDTGSGIGVHEKLVRRPVFSFMTKLHYNPGRAWTYFADAFAIAMILITLSGICMMKGKKGILGWGGLEFGAGILIPALILLVS